MVLTHLNITSKYGSFKYDIKPFKYEYDIKPFKYQYGIKP